MTSAPWKSLTFVLAMLSAAPALAQIALEPVSSHGDWTVFVADDPKECYIASQPTASAARRDGQPVEVSRGDIRLFVRFNPSESARNEVSYRSGYPLATESPVGVTIGAEAFSLSPVNGDANEWAWPSPEDDARVVAAMRGGSTATVTGVSARGTTTTDTFSLAGFTAAINEAQSRCE